MTRKLSLRELSLKKGIPILHFQTRHMSLPVLRIILLISACIFSISSDSEMFYPFSSLTDARAKSAFQPSSNLAVNTPIAATDDTAGFDIPELSWRTDLLPGSEMTVDIAKKYPPGNFLPRTKQNPAWNVGEKLVFSVDYGFYKAGTATMSVNEIADVNGDKCYHILTTAESNDFISNFYKVRDKVDSYIDAKGMFSRRFEKHLREGKYKSDRIVDFYHDRKIALNTEKKHALTEIPLYVHDVLSALYYLRTKELVVGRDEFVDVYADGKVYPLKVIVHKKETVKVKAGKFSCIKIEPIMKSEGIFKQEGKLTVWITDDEYKIPVKMSSKVLIGSIGTNLESYQMGTSR